MVAARRGDLAVLSREERTFYVGRPTETRQRVEACVVTSIRRDGTVRAVRDSWGHVREVRRDEQVHVVSRDAIDVEAAYDAARRHAYPGHPDQPMPFDSLCACRAVLGPHLREASRSKDA